jgi:hypothetical protein
VRFVLGRKDDSDGCVAQDAAERIVDGGTILDAMRTALTSSELNVWRD